MRIFFVVLFILLQVQPASPPPFGSRLDPVNGIAWIGWENSVGADAVIATLDRADCPIAARGAPGDTGDPQQANTQVPSGPPFNEHCLLRPGDHVSLQRWRNGEHIDTIGPYYVPVRIWLPVVRSDTKPIQ